MARVSASPIRLLTGVPICDGHDSAITTINLEFIRHGIEVVYLGYHRQARDIARAAVQEDVRAIGISSYNGGHVEFFSQVVKFLAEYGAKDIGVFGGGGGTITQADARVMAKAGVDRIFFAGTPLVEMIGYVKETWGGTPPLTAPARSSADHRLGRILTETTQNDLKRSGSSNGVGFAVRTTSPRAEKMVRTADPTEIDPRHADRDNSRTGRGKTRQPHRPPLVVGVCGPGGAGKTTLIDELLLRFLKANDETRIAVLSHDPSIVGNGAILGDRAAMFYSQSDRVFMRSLASSGRAGGLSPATERCLEILKIGQIGGGFDVILVETVGIGQEAIPFSPGMVDRTVFVMSPEYGSRLQLQKIAMLDAADIVVINKSDQVGAKTASAELEQRLGMNHRGQRLVGAVAKRHRDEGVNQLFEILNADPSEAILPAAKERPTHERTRRGC